MKRILPVVALALVTLIVIITSGRSTPEEKIQAVLVGLEKDFNRGRSGPASEAFTESYRDQSGIGQTDVRTMIAQAWFSQRDSKTKEFLYRATLPVEEMQITIDGADATRATVEMIAHFERKRGSEWRTVWKALVTAEVVETDDGWRLASSRHQTLEGRPFR